jgi:hypothetical protein
VQLSSDMPLMCLHMASDTLFCRTHTPQGGRAVDGTLQSTEVLQLGTDQWKLGPGMVLPRTALAAAALQVPTLGHQAHHDETALAHSKRKCASQPPAQSEAHC